MEHFLVDTTEVWYSPTRDRFGLLVRRKFYSVWSVPMIKQVGVHFEVSDRGVISYDDVRHAKHEDQWIKIGDLK